jgi:hypothetical protein
VWSSSSRPPTSTSPTGSQGSTPEREDVLNDGAVVDTEIARKPWNYDVRVHVGTWNGEHMYWGKMPEAMFGRWIIVTEHGKLWLEENAGEWVGFKPLPVKQ